MAAVMAKPPVGTATKMKKPPTPTVQTNINGVRTSAPSASPSSARKTLPGQTQTPTSATSNGAATNGATRPNRRLQRLTTRNNMGDGGAQDKRATKKYPEPYVPTESHILRKFKGCPPSLIVHLHPTHFRFDQQDGSFSYHSEMRFFIEHLQDGTIPHDMVEEFRKSDVKYYEGWLIVRVIDKRSAAKDASASGTGSDDEKPFSIHNYNQYITASSYAPYPTKEQTANRSPQLKQESSDQKDALRSDDTVRAPPKSSKPQARVYHIALRPTTLSRHMDLAFDAMQPDPKSLNRKGSQANVTGRAGGSGGPQTPISGMPPTPSAEKGPPFKKQKLKIDPKDIVEYEARVVNATAPPLYLDPVGSLEEVENLLHQLKDPHCDQRPPSPKSRKRTVAELAADDAQAKEQERFMMVLDERSAGTNGATNAGAGDGQAAAALFQPRFEKFNALDNIKRELAQRKQREKDQQLQEDENRRGQQERMQEEEKKRAAMQRAQEQRILRARQAEVAAQMAAQQQQPQAPQPIQRPTSSQVNGIPPNVRNQIMQGGSPVIRQGTPHAASSPIVTSAAQGAMPMAMSGSQQGHGSPTRPGSAVQHGHPSAPMTRGPSQQGPSRNGTPQIPHGTPAQRNATPIMRQNTPAQAGSHASPHGATPQMMPTGMIPNMQSQIPNGVPRQFTQQQVAEMQRRQALQQQHQAQQAAMQQGMANGTPQMSQVQMAHLQAQHAQAQANREAAMRQQAMQSQQGTPQTAHMSPNPNQNQKSYNQSVIEAMKAQMQNVPQQGQPQGSPAANQMTPQQQQAQMAHAQQQQRMMQAAQAQAQGQMMNQQGMPHPQQPQQQRVPMDPETQRQFTGLVQSFQQRYIMQAAAKYGGNTQMLQPQEIHQIKINAQKAAQVTMSKQRQQMSGQMNPMQAAQMHQMRQQMAAQQQQQQQGGGQMPNGMMAMQPSMQQPNQVQNQNTAQLLQQQQAQQMQQLQMQHAQQMMAAQQHQQQQQQQNMQFQPR